MLSLEIIMAFFMLTALEIVLGVDNIIFLSILTNRLPANEQANARKFGLFLAMFTRILLLFSLTWLIGFTKPFITVMEHTFSGRDLVLILGGLFLIAKSTGEIQETINHTQAVGSNIQESSTKKSGRFWSTVIQIAIIDIVFSLDSVITAVGLVNHLSVMVAAIVCAIGIMMFLAKPVSDFIDRRPTLKLLALSFLILIGVALFADGLGFHFPKSMIYFAMIYALIIEMLNHKLIKKNTS